MRGAGHAGAGAGRRVGPRVAVFVAAAVDAVGTGMFLPMALLFQIRVVGLTASTAGAVTAVATLVSLAVPALVGALVDRTGARRMVIAAFAVQGLGTAGLLAAHGSAAALAATLAAAAGQRAFWASLFTLLGDVAGPVAKEQVFATAGMMQSAGATVGALAAGPLMAVGSVGSYRFVVALNAVSFLGGVLVVMFGVPPQRPVRAAPAAAAGFRQVLADRGFLTLMAAYTSITFTVALCTVVAPVFVIDVLHLPGWQPSLLLGSVTLATATLRGRAVTLLRRRS
ncbi:MFS transporter, partial [Kitasatospora sp. NPDC002227]|uniref:MFS transporter n=1 Tax=Kitasatospora sp. NPDC002227 TaxID=3154773 RepID=UPI003324A9C8